MTRIDDINARLEAATDGPWWDESGVIHAKAPHWTPEVHSCDHVAKADPHENATFIANAPADIAYLLRRIQEADDLLRVASHGLKCSPSDRYQDLAHEITEWRRDLYEDNP